MCGDARRCRRPTLSLPLSPQRKAQNTAILAAYKAQELHGGASIAHAPGYGVRIPPPSPPP